MNYQNIESSKSDQTFKKRTKIFQKKDIFFGIPKLPKKDHYGSWIFPQILAHFGAKKLVYKDFKVSSTLTLERWNLRTEEKIWLEYITTSPRSSFLESRKYPSLSQSVPLALSAFKIYQNVLYESWDFEDPNIKVFLEPLQFQLILLRDHNLPDPKTLDWKALEKKLESWFSFGEWEAQHLGSLPRLAKHIFTQTWIWHPLKLHHLAIQSLKCWDLPEPNLHQSNIFVSG